MWQTLLIAVVGLFAYNYVTTGAAFTKMQTEVAGFRFYKLTLKKTIIDIDVRLTNLSVKTITLQGVQFAIYMNDRYLGNSSMPLNCTLGNYSSMVVRLRVEMTTQKLLNLLNSYLSTSGNNYTLKINLNGRIAGNGASFPLNLVFAVRIPSLVALVNRLKNMFEKNDTQTDLSNSDLVNSLIDKLQNND